MNQKRGTVLFVDDEIQVLNSLKRGLLEQQYTCLFASSGKDALNILGKNEISVIVTDMRMPEMNGLQLLKEVDMLSPKTVKIVLTGYTQVNQILATINSVNIFRFVTKPWELDDELIPILQQAIDYYLLEEINQQLKVDLEKKNEAYEHILDSMKNKISSVKRYSAIVSKLGLEMLTFANEHAQTEVSAFRFLLSIQTSIFDAVMKTTTRDEDTLELGELTDTVAENLKAVVKLHQKSRRLPAIAINANANLIAAYFRVALLVLREETRNIPMNYETAFTGNRRLRMTLTAPYTEVMSSNITQQRMQYINRVMGSSARAGEYNCYAEMDEKHLSMTVMVPVEELQDMGG